jgi:type VI secretion system protein ImpK
MPLIEKLHAFYREVLAADEEMKAGRQDARAVCDSLVTVIRNLRFRAETESGRPQGGDIFERATYAMAALADEHFLRPESSIRKEWGHNVLEKALFDTQAAGAKLFSDIDSLQTEHRKDAPELAPVYLAVLGLGFRGKFRGPDAEDKLAAYRRRLRQFILGEEPPSDRIVAAAYTPTVADHPTTELPYLWPWAVALGSIFILWIAVGDLLWRSSISDVNELIHAFNYVEHRVGASS